MTIVMYDSIDLSQFPPNPEAVAGYVGGHWPTYNELVAKFPNALHLSIAVQASQHARCLDVEPGDATPAQAPGWFQGHADHSQGLPVLYGSASAVNEINTAMQRAGISRDRYLIWSAHYTFHAHICSPQTCGYPPADATQWTDKSGGKNLDESLCSDAFFGTKPPDSTQGEEMIASALSDGGTLHVWWVVGDGQTVRYRYQKSGSSDWQDGGVFTKAPKKIAGLSATLSNTGTLEVFVRYTDANVSHCWQKKGSTSWSGGTPRHPQPRRAP